MYNVFNIARKLLDAVNYSFSPPAGASSKKIRSNGLYCLLLGVISMVLFGWGSTVVGGAGNYAEYVNILLMVPALASFSFVGVGGYRLLTGNNPKAEPGEVSWLRIALGLFSILMVFFLLMLIAFFTDILTERGPI